MLHTKAQWAAWSPFYVAGLNAQLRWVTLIIVVVIFRPQNNLDRRRRAAAYGTFQKKPLSQCCLQTFKLSNFQNLKLSNFQKRASFTVWSSNCPSWLWMFSQLLFGRYTNENTNNIIWQILIQLICDTNTLYTNIALLCNVTSLI